MDLKPVNLTGEEEAFLRFFVAELEKGQKIEVEKLSLFCNNPYSLAKAYSDYVKDWEKTEKIFGDNLRSGHIPPETGINLYKEMIRFSGVIMERKLEAVRMLYEHKFGGSIYDYVGQDGKIKGMFSAMRDIWKNR